MVAGLPKVLECGALSTDTSFSSVYQSSLSAVRRSFLRASVMEEVEPMVRHSLRVERTKPATPAPIRSKAASCAGGGGGSGLAPFLRYTNPSQLIPYFDLGRVAQVVCRTTL